jgi:hypothetical protein
MSRVVRISDPNYKISVASGGEITLDTGNQIGVVRITGDLIVEGETTTINTTNLAIEDRIVELNVNDPGPQVTGGLAGIKINRGTNPSFPDTGVFFDESLVYLDSQSAQNRVGGFTLRDDNERLVGLQTNAIFTTPGTDLVLLGATIGSPTVTVGNAVDYADRVTDPNDIPNRRFVELFVENYFETVPPEFIKAGDSVLQIFDESQDPETMLRLTLNSQTSAVFRPDSVQLQEIRISENAIETFTTNRDLVLSADGIGAVVIDDVLKINGTATAPLSEIDGVKIYTNNQAFGGTGVFFVNAQNNRDELVSRRKAIAYSMIF